MTELMEQLHSGRTQRLADEYRQALRSGDANAVDAAAAQLGLSEKEVDADRKTLDLVTKGEQLLKRNEEQELAAVAAYTKWGDAILSEIEAADCEHCATEMESLKEDMARLIGMWKKLYSLAKSFAALELENARLKTEHPRVWGA